jgi:hypothetical protein
MNRRDAETQRKDTPEYVQRIMSDAKPFENVTKPRSNDGGKYRCPCCNYRTLDERGGYDICQVCFWEDDGQDDHDADEIRGGPNGTLSLTQARQNFKQFKVADKRFISNVRPPRQDEI